jgi:uncharacterized membrane protein YbhN (UPF0104 family)
MPASSPSSLRRRLRALVPWGVAALVLVYVFSHTSGPALAGALARVSLWRFALVLLGLTVGALLADAWVIWLALRATAQHVEQPRDAAGDSAARPALAYRDVFLVRGASALLSLLSYGAGQGGVMYFLYRRHGISVAAGASAVLLATAASMAVLALLSGLGILAGAIPDRPEIRAVAWAALAAVPAYVGLVAARPRFLLRHQLFRALFAVRPAALVRVLGARVLHLGVLITGHWLVMRLFGIAVPPAAALLRLPAMFMVAALPISPAGLGTTQAAAITLFSSHAVAPDQAAREATVLAYSLSCHVAGVVVLVLAGLVCWRWLPRAGVIAPDRSRAGVRGAAPDGDSDRPNPCSE